MNADTSCCLAKHLILTHEFGHWAPGLVTKTVSGMDREWIFMNWGAPLVTGPRKMPGPRRIEGRPLLSQA